MGIRTLLYLFRLGLKNLWHHRVYTAASVITMSACIFLFGLFYLAAANVDSMVKKTEQEVYVAVFFDEGILPERVEDIGNLIQSRPEVLRTVYVSADEAWSGFKEKYYENAEALDGIFATDNPLASSGNYQVYIDRIGSQEGFLEYVQSIEGVRKTTHSADTVMALLKLRQGAARLIAGRLCENSFYGGGCCYGSGRSGYPADSSDVAVPLGTCLCRFRSEWSGQPERTGVRASHRGPGISRTYPCVRTPGDFYRGCGRIVCYGEVEAQEERALMCVVSYNGDLI